MADELHWIPIDLNGRLATMPRPRGGDWLDFDLARFQRAGVTGLVSLLESDEEAELELSLEQSACAHRGLSFRAYPVADRSHPADSAAFWTFARELRADVAAGRVIAVHCRAGIGRASLLAAAVLALGGTPAEDVFDVISEARGLSVPDTREQRDWFIAAAAAEGRASVGE